MSFLHTVSYNVDVAKVFGVNSAILLSTINSRIYFSADTVDYTEVALSRDDIYNMTGMPNDIQKKSEDALIMSGVIVVKPFRLNSDKNYYSINHKVLTDVMNSGNLIYNEDDFGYIKKVVTEKKKRVPKRVKEVADLKKVIETTFVDITDHIELKQLMMDWVDSVYSNPKGFLSKQSMLLSLKDVLEIKSKEDRENVMAVAIKNGYRDISWAINRVCTADKKQSSYNFDVSVASESNIVEEAF